MILPDYISQNAKLHPEKTAFYFKDEKTTFEELDDRIRHVAGGLTDLGLKKGSTVGLVLRNSPEFVIMSMALASIGAISVPINFLEKPEQIALILNDAKAEVIFASREFLGTVLTAAKKIKTVKHIILKDGAQEGIKEFKTLLESQPRPISTRIDEDDLVMLLYTSGTTGLPKGVMLTHKNLMANVDQCLSAIKVTSNDVFICLLPMFHSFAWTTCVLIPLKRGLPIVIMETLLPFDPVIRAIWKYKVTIFIGVPQIFSALCQKISGAKAFLVRLLNPVRLCISGAAPLPTTIFHRFKKTFKIPLIEGYGLTETSPVCALNPIEKIKMGTVGPALQGVSIEIHDDAGKLLSQGEVGEIWIKGDNVMKGYFQKPEETRDVLTPSRWLKTGDLGRLDEEGYLSIVDRKKDLIIVKGLNVYPQDVEKVISQHPKVSEVAVVGKLDPATGEETIRAFITLKEGAKAGKPEMMDLCRENLAPYKRPKEIIFLDKMPKNSLQKILKKDLRNL